MLEAEPRAGAAASDPASRASAGVSYSVATRHDPYVSRSPDLAANGGPNPIPNPHPDLSLTLSLSLSLTLTVAPALFRRTRRVLSLTDPRGRIAPAGTKIVVAAHFDRDDLLGGVVRCDAPPAKASYLPTDATSVIALELALNAQDYTTQRRMFTVYPRPAVLSLSPSSGPSTGDTLVRLTGANLENGSDYRCLFGMRSVLVEPG